MNDPLIESAKEIEALRSRAAGDASELEHLRGSIEALRAQVAALTADVSFWNTTFLEAREGYEKELAAMTQERDVYAAANRTAYDGMTAALKQLSAAQAEIERSKT